MPTRRRRPRAHPPTTIRPRPPPTNPRLLRQSNHLHQVRRMPATCRPSRRPPLSLRAAQCQRHLTSPAHTPRFRPLRPSPRRRRTHLASHMMQRCSSPRQMHRRLAFHPTSLPPRQSDPLARRLRPRRQAVRHRAAQSPSRLRLSLNKSGIRFPATVRRQSAATQSCRTRPRRRQPLRASSRAVARSRGSQQCTHLRRHSRSSSPRNRQRPTAARRLQRRAVARQNSAGRPSS